MIKPQPKQELFLSSSADIAIYGGAAGGGKTYALLMEAIRHINIPEFGAVLFRRTREQVKYEGGLWDESETIYKHTEAIQKAQALEWVFPSGAKVSFRDLQRESDLQKYKGSQIALLAFDQLEEFTEKQFFYMMSRNRSTCGIRPYIRATCNPKRGWLHNFISWWIDDDGYADLSKSGVIRWFIRVKGIFKWGDTKEELKEIDPDSHPLSVTFIPSTVYDNKKLLEADPAYIGKLKAMSFVDTERLLGDKTRGGNWKIKAEAGTVFNSDWFKIVQSIPELTNVCRFWDVAGTEKQLRRNDPDYTAGVLLGISTEGMYYVLDCIAVQQEPTERDLTMKRTAIHDIAEWGDKYTVGWEKQPAVAGKTLDLQLAKIFNGFSYQSIAPKGDKVLRASPSASSAKLGKYFILEGDWNSRFMEELHEFPDGAHDDIVDANSGAHDLLARVAPLLLW